MKDVDKLTIAQNSAVKISEAVMNIIWYLSLITLALLVILAVVDLTGILDFPDLGVVMALSVKAFPASESDFDIKSTDRDHDYSHLHLNNFRGVSLATESSKFSLTGRPFVFAIGAMVILAVIWIVYYLRRLIRTIFSGQPFVPENSLNLRRIAYAVIIIGPAVGILSYLYGALISSAIRITGFELMPEFDLHLEIVALGFLVLVIAQVFDYGIQLKNDRDLTI
jgi:hypothetical protein